MKRYPRIGFHRKINSFAAVWIVIPLSLGITTAASAQQSNANGVFAECLVRLEVEATNSGLNSQLVSEIFANITPRQQVVRADRNQPEFLTTFGDYLGRRVNDRRIRIGRELYNQHRPQLDELARLYGVPGQYVVAFWGLETDFGNVLGDVSVFDSLSTLACDGRRGSYFTRELMVAIELAQNGDVAVRDMIGSWAGAMGQTQFMPSNYIRYGIDGNNDGRIDLWNTAEDAIASAAHFLQQIGWQRELRWGREVLLPDDFDFTTAGRNQRRPLRAWSMAGITDTTGRLLPALDIDAAILVPTGGDGPAFVVYENFDVIMRWNRSENFALTVGHLADRIAGGAGLAITPPRGERISRQAIADLQTLLAREGYDVGSADGVFGPRSRAALRAWQRDRGLAADGYPSAQLLVSLNIIGLE